MHAEFTDGFVSAVDEQACRAHLDQCSTCAKHDVQVRRSLLVLQALPQIEPSADFRKTLERRLAHERLAGAWSAQSPSRAPALRWTMAGAILAASIAVFFVDLRDPRWPQDQRQVPAATHRIAQAAAPAQRSPGLDSVPVARNAGPRRPAVAATMSARFEALPGQMPLPGAPRVAPVSTVRLQAVSYLGQ